MFELASLDASAHSVEFATAESYGWTHPKGGWQGGASIPPAAAVSVSLSPSLAGVWLRARLAPV